MASVFKTCLTLSISMGLVHGFNVSPFNLDISPRDIDNCPGVYYVGAGDASACCVGGVQQPQTISVCDGWPICKGPVTVTQTQVPLSCATLIPVTDSNYDSLVGEASASLKKSGTHYQTTLGSAPLTSLPTGTASTDGSGPSVTASITSPPTTESATGSVIGSTTGQAAPSTGDSARLSVDMGLALVSFLIMAWL